MAPSRDHVWTEKHRGFKTPLPTRIKSLPQQFGTMVALDIVRGGARELLDLPREALKLQSMGTYSTIAALILNASLRLYTSQKFESKEDTNGKRPRVLHLLESIFTASSTLCIISGLFTAVLFNVLGIYSRAALGLGNDTGYIAFQTMTAMYRKWGFRTFLISCLSFVISFLASVFEKTSKEDRLGQVILVSSILLALVGMFHIHAVLRIATEVIYTSPFKAKHHIA